MRTTDTESITTTSVPDISEKNNFDDTYERTSGKSERLFTQAELEKCIGERLTRERRNNASLDNIKKLIDSLSQRGVLNADSYAQAEKEICEKLSLLDAENMRLSDSAKCTVTNTKSSFAAKAVTADGREICAESNAEESADTGKACGDAGLVCEESPVSDFLELCENYPDIDAEGLIKSAPFISYCRGRSGTLCELYKGYSSLLEALTNFNSEKSGNRQSFSDDSGEKQISRDRHAAGALSSTGFSQRSASEASDFASMLSPSQRSIAKRAGISYSEYALLLRDIPDSSRIKKQR